MILWFVVVVVVSEAGNQAPDPVDTRGVLCLELMMLFKETLKPSGAWTLETGSNFIEEHHLEAAESGH